MQYLLDAGLYIAPAVVIGLLGGLLTAVHAPSEVLKAHIEHLAAGVLLAVIAFSVSVEIRELDQLPATGTGLLIGAALMVAMKTFLRRFDTPRDDPTPTGFVMAAVIDTFVDGLLIGAAFAFNPSLAILVLVGLTIELFVVNMSVSAELRAIKLGLWKILCIALAIPLALAVGSVFGLFTMKDASPQLQAGILAFALAALLYLVAEELLLRGNDAENSPKTTSSFFAGFILMSAFIMWSEAG